jgi:hypothetical protein
MVLTTNSVLLTIADSGSTLNTGYDTFYVDASGGSMSLVLPDATIETGGIFIIRRVDTTTNTLTITGTSSQTIDGLLSIIISAKTSRSITTTADSSNWQIVFSHIYPTTSYVQLTTDSTTSSATFVSLLSLTIITSGNTSLLVRTSFSGDNSSASAAQNLFAIFVDSTQVIAGEITVSTGANQSGALEYKTPILSAGSHTVELRWATSLGTARIRPITNPNTDNASLTSVEVI